MKGKRTGSSAASASSSSCWTASAEASAPEPEPARGLPAEGWTGALDEEEELELEPPLTSTPFLRVHTTPTPTINKSAQHTQEQIVKRMECNMEK